MCFLSGMLTPANLGIKEKVQRDAYEILKKTEESRIAEGKNPVAQAASSLYLACILNRVDISQRVFAEVSGVSSVTIRNRISIIRKTLNLEY